jgi:hypothetical protein
MVDSEFDQLSKTFFKLSTIVLDDIFQPSSRSIYVHMHHQSPDSWQHKSISYKLTHQSSHLEIWAKFAHTAQLLSPDKETNRYRNQSHTQKCQQTCCPRYTKVMEHRGGEQREACASKAPEERIGRNGRVGVHHVHIDDVAQALNEDHEDS